MTVSNVRRRGLVVVLAGVGISLAFGVLYAWSVIKGGLPHSWSNTEKALPYAVACLVFSLMMVPAGRLQDRLGPRWVATLGGIFLGGGLLVAGAFPSVSGFLVGFGLLAGTGIGLGYAATTPAAVKWFPPEKTGLVTGVVVAGFGLASVYIAPLVEYLLETFRPEDAAGALADVPADSGSLVAISSTMFTLGIAFLAVTIVLAQLLRNPSPEERALVMESSSSQAAVTKTHVGGSRTAREMLSTRHFYVLWTMYLFAAGAGLMVISVLKGLTRPEDAKYGFYLVAFLAVGNAGGRVVAGVVSDRIGRVQTLRLASFVQAGLMLLLIFSGSYPFALLVLLTMLIGAHYGANLSVFPSVTKDWYGLENFGVNYGFLFTAWGLGGFLLSFLLGGRIKDWTGSYSLAFVIAAILLVLAGGLSFMVRQPPAFEEGLAK